MPATSSRFPTRLYDAYLFDLDGTIYLGDELLPGVPRLMDTLRSLNKDIRFLTNNPTRDPEQYADKLTGLGVPVSPSEVITSAISMSKWLVQQHPSAKVFPIGEAPLIRALSDAGIAISEDPADIDIVIASYDRTFEYRKLQIAFDALWFHKRAKLVTTNPGRYCPMPGGRGEPDAAAIVGAIEACTGVKCELNVGKPHPTMLTAVRKDLNRDAADCIMVGDLLTTDIRMARAAAMPSALVLTGATTLSMLEGAAASDLPDFILERVDQVLPKDHLRVPV